MRAHSSLSASRPQASTAATASSTTTSCSSTADVSKSKKACARHLHNRPYPHVRIGWCAALAGVQSDMARSLNNDRLCMMYASKKMLA